MIPIQMCSTVESNHERLVGVKFNLKKESFLLISLYAPTAGHDDDFMETLSHLSHYILQHSSNGDNVIIGTDSNCSSKSTSRRQQSWSSFLEAYFFGLLEKWHSIPAGMEWSFHSGRNEGFHSDRNGMVAFHSGQNGMAIPFYSEWNSHASN